MTKRPLLAYFSIACLVSWLAWLPRIASQQGWWGWLVPEWWHYAGAAGPITAALLVTYRTEGRAGVTDLLSQFRVRPAAGWLLFALGSPLVLFAIGAAVARGVTGAWPAFAEVAKTQNLPALGLPLTLVVHVMTFGIGEETGWRGFALPRLQARHDALRATLLLSVGWGLWHVPSFFGNSGFADFGPVDIVGWFIGLVLGAIFLTWLYNSTRGSLMVIVLWHGLFNALVASEAAAGLIAAVMTTGVMVLAVVALVRSGGQNITGLSPGTAQRQVARTARRGARGGTATAAALLGLLVVSSPSTGQTLQPSPADVPAPIDVTGIGSQNTGEDRAHLNLRVTRWPDSDPGTEQDAPPPTRRDSVLNGLLIGAGIGAVVGLIPDHYDDCEECHDSLYGSIAVGAGVGLLVDVLRVQSTASPSSRQTSLRLDVGSRSARVRIAGIVRWR